MPLVLLWFPGSSVHAGPRRLVEGEEGLLRDPFDVTEPEDLVDGQPVDEERFWNRVRSLPHTVFNPCLGAKGVTLT